jgi:hypothetical protein
MTVQRDLVYVTFWRKMKQSHLASEPPDVYFSANYSRLNVQLPVKDGLNHMENMGYQEHGLHSKQYALGALDLIRDDLIAA